MISMFKAKGESMRLTGKITAILISLAMIAGTLPSALLCKVDGNDNGRDSNEDPWKVFKEERLEAL